MSLAWHALSLDEILNHLATNLKQGLTQNSILDRQKVYGYNKIITTKNDTPLKRIGRQFNHALIYILLFAAAVAIYLKSWVDATVILGVVVLNAVFGYFQEEKAQKALAAIRSMLPLAAKVIREGKKTMVPAFQLVPGDIVIVSRGDKIPADIRISESKNLQLQEAMLTGESLPIEKHKHRLSPNTILSERSNMLYSGTLVTDGYGIGVVVAIGNQTEVGKINVSLTTTPTLDTPLLRQMNRFGRWLTLFILLVALLVFGVGVLVWHDASSQMLMAIVGLTVAAVPEGLPPIMTIILALGVTRMAKRKAIIRRLPAVETMGAVTTICTDKTGTLTCNQLVAQTIVTAKQLYELSDLKPAALPEDLNQALFGVILCNDVELPTGEYSQPNYGNPLDIALITLGQKFKINLAWLRKQFPQTDLIPYESEHKFMATLHHDYQGDSLIYLKGAPELILARCQFEQATEQTLPINYQYWQKQIESLAALGERVIAVAVKKPKTKLVNLNFAEVQDGLILIALVGLIDPPRPEAIAAVAECQQASIKVKMITGDHAATAKAIATMVGIAPSEILTGEMIDRLSDKELTQSAAKINIYARTTPQHKLRLVKALQQQGEVVAMTGDGLNDAPALKQADIGIAMGNKGADLAKESAAMVLADDNFATIVHAVSEGRTIYTNLQKAIAFIMPTSLAQALAVIVAILFGLVVPITPVQILWVNMITAVTLSLAFGFEPAEPEVMQCPPRDPQAPIFSWYLVWRSFLVAFILVAFTFALFMLMSTQNNSLANARSAAVNLLVFGEAAYLINCRHLRSSSMNWQTFFGSKPIWFAILAVVICQILFTYLPWMQHFFNTVALGFKEWLYILVAAALTFILVELEKAVLVRYSNT